MTIPEYRDENLLPLTDEQEALAKKISEEQLAKKNIDLSASIRFGMQQTLRHVQNMELSELETEIIRRIDNLKLDPNMHHRLSLVPARGIGERHKGKLPDGNRGRGKKRR